MLIDAKGNITRAAPTPIKLGPRKLKNWLRTYLEYTSDNEAPQNYHLWVGLGTIAGAAQRKVYMETEYFFVHSNLYVVLVGPPGTKKNTALRQGKKMLKQVPGVNFTSNATSVAGLIQQFTAITNKAHQSLTTYAYELGSLFALSKIDMVDFLTDIFDGEPDWDKQTRAHANEKIAHPWFNLMAGTTPTWLGDNLTRTAIEGGFVARSLFVWSSERILKSPFPDKKPAHAALQRDLVHDLAKISQIEGEFVFDLEAREFYDAWYLDASRFPILADNRTAGYYARKHVFVLKVAMALSLAEDDGLVLSRRDIETALKLLGSIESDMKHAFSSVGGHTYATDMERVRNQIFANKSMTYGELVASNYHALDKRTLDSLLEYLLAMGEVERPLIVGGPITYRMKVKKP